jgi:hypothetical protein
MSCTSIEGSAHVLEGGLLSTDEPQAMVADTRSCSPGVDLRDGPGRLMSGPGRGASRRPARPGRGSGRLYMTASALNFEAGRTQIHQELAVKSEQGAASRCDLRSGPLRNTDEEGYARLPWVSTRARRWLGGPAWIPATSTG